MKHYGKNSLSIGNTPLIRIRRMAGGADILAKIEGRNPAYSVKCRTAAALIESLRRKGLLKENTRLIEPTSGNTGISLAFISAVEKYDLTLVMPDSVSIERRKLISAFGAKLILTDGAKGMGGSIAKVNEIIEESKGRYLMPGQFTNRANPEIHRMTTGPEIWNDTDGKVDVFVAGVGTGGTVSGTSQYLKLDRGKPILSVAVEPAGSPVIGQKLRGEKIQPGPHKIQGIGAGFIPKTLDLSIIDRVAGITDDEAFDAARRLAREEGIISGISSGAAMAAALKISREPEMEGKQIVVLLPDSGERYLSTPLFD